MYDRPGQNGYRGGGYIGQRGGSIGNLPTIFEGPADTALELSAPQECRSGQAKTTTRRGSKPIKTSETTDGVEAAINSPDSEAFSAKTQGRGNKGCGDKQISIGVYLGVSQARAPQGDRRALYGLPNGGD